ncbi:MAG: glycosyltransferase family 39 protein [Acetobacteraceae bacterium]|nr:glycosyltransferase family 39 protein [Acetobacteraceae bacterium]
MPAQAVEHPAPHALSHERAVSPGPSRPARPGNPELKLALAGLALITLLRMVVAAVTPLSPDEAYYWVWSRALAPSYLDHPPMVALWIRAGTLLAGDTAFGVRLSAPISAAAGSALLAQAGDLLLPGRNTGIVAAALLNATLLFGAGAVIITPDTPLLFFWTATLWALARFLQTRRGAWLLMAGLMAGLASDSKYTAILLGPGALIWVLAVPALRVWLRRPEPWLAAFLSASLFAPVVLWNAEHAWVSFAKQGGRAGAWDPARSLQFLSELIGGQAGLATPLIFVLCMAGVAHATARAFRDRDPACTLLSALSFLPILIFLQHAIGDRVQANWPAIIYPAAAIAGAGLLHGFWLRLRAPAIVLGLALGAAVYAQAIAAPVSLSPHIDPTLRQLAGWNGLAKEVTQVANERNASFVAADEYGLAAELARSLPQGLPVLGVDPRWELFALPRMPVNGQPGLLVRTTRRKDDINQNTWREEQEVATIARRRDGNTAETYRVFRVVGGSNSETRLPSRQNNY